MGMALSQCIPGLENTSFFRVKSGSQPSRRVFFRKNLQFNHLYLTVTKAPCFPLEKKNNNTQKNLNSVKSASIRPGLHSSRHSLSQSGSAGTTFVSPNGSWEAPRRGIHWVMKPP